MDRRSLRLPLEELQKSRPSPLTYPNDQEGGGMPPGGARGWEGTAGPEASAGAPGWSSRREHQVAAGREAGLQG